MEQANSPIKSAALKLALESASHVIGADEDEYIVFPAIDFAKKAKPPAKNLNTDPDGPCVVQVTVQQLGEDARRGYYGHAGIERLTLLLPRDTLGQWANRLEGIRSLGPLAVDASVDEHGEVVDLALDGEPVVIPVSSETLPVNERAASTGTD